MARARPESGSIRPTVAIRGGSLQVWIFGAALAIASLFLFMLLDSRRRALTAPAVRAGDGGVARAATPLPPLFIPPEPLPLPIPAPSPTPIAPPAPLRPAPVPQYLPIPRMPEAPPVEPMLAPAPPAPRSTESALIVDTTAPEGPAAGGGATGAGPDGGGALTSATARASVMRHRPTTVPQGALIPAVLESALDSTRPGFARAIVSRDVRGSDGAQVLIPRGSRLIGEYRADLQPGQNRALITWTRLVRPDGVIIAIQSPAADTLGRAGVRGRVNSHFFERFGSAILQSALDIGVNVASRAGSGSSVAVIGLPGIVQNTTQPLTNGAQIRPTLKVAAGVSIMVFVARDLDFTSVENKRR